MNLKRKKIYQFIVDETIIRVGSGLIWLWVAIEPENKQILAVNISTKRETYLLLKDPCQN
jgi:putative transposase